MMSEKAIYERIQLLKRSISNSFDTLNEKEEPLYERAGTIQFILESNVEQMTLESVLSGRTRINSWWCEL